MHLLVTTLNYSNTITKILYLSHLVNINENDLGKQTLSQPCMRSHFDFRTLQINSKKKEKREYY